MLELLSPAGDFAKLKTAIHFGADAVYLGGNDFSLRAFSGNFDNEGLKTAFDYLHNFGKKGYIATNIFAKNDDFGKLTEYFQYIEQFADGVIITDAGVIELCKKVAPKLEIHLSTQANTTNKYSAKFWAENGISRIVLARELSLQEIAEIRDFLPSKCSLEAFVHGAMCISYSGRCLLSNYLTTRDSNRGECVQACRWNYLLAEKEYSFAEESRTQNPLSLSQDNRGSYILNSKDLNMFKYIDKMIEAGVESFKIEGRMKSEYYVGTITNCYAKALDCIRNKQPIPANLEEELFKTGHRQYTTAYALGKNEHTQCYESAIPTQSFDFVAIVEDCKDGKIIVEHRNRFEKGDVLEVLSPTENLNKTIVVDQILDMNGNELDVAKIVQQKLQLKTDLKLLPFDILRRKKA